ncbi:ABC transporter permease [Benzoatithermus flavus]|uniref:ABC transporter permease n=1 Tax=Benzoatithermus flavus TaxID=3108223 RepID=A0ABU8XSR5_9PROT
MQFEVIWENIGQYVHGLWTTVWLVAASLALGLVLAVPLAILRTSKNPLINGPVWFYTYFFRGTPLLVQLFMLYYGAPQFPILRESFLWPLLTQAWFCALVAFTLNTAAYTTEIIRGAIVTTPHGEIEAARACGMSHALMMRRIVLPSAFRRALPAYGNEVIFMLHGSAVASVVTIVDLTGAARNINSTYYTPYEAFLTAGLFYMALTFLIVWVFRRIERRLLVHLRRPAA